MSIQPIDEAIVIRGAREHNLKNIDVTIPKGQLVVVTGLSGSGKSSLAFDTIFAEGQRRYIESLSAYARQFLGVLNRPDVDSITGLSPAIAVDQKNATRSPRSTVGTITEIYDHLRLLFARIGQPHCPQCGRPITQQTPQQIVDAVLRLPDNTRLMMLAPLVEGRQGTHAKVFDDVRRAGFVRVRVDGTVLDVDEAITLDKHIQHSIEIVVDRLVIRQPEPMPAPADHPDRIRVSDSVETALKASNGIVVAAIVGGDELRFSEFYACPEHGPLSGGALEPRSFSFNSPRGACPTCTGLGEVLTDDRAAPCPTCLGQRLRPEILAVTVAGENIATVTKLSIDQVWAWSGELATASSLSERERLIAAPIVREILARLQFLLDVGLHYLTLDRAGATLSGGEAQRIRLATQIGAGLSGVLYVLDEPSIGLHPRDNERLLQTLLNLRDLGNSVLVVEHDETIIRAAQWVLEIGPGAGTHGGQLIAIGSPSTLAADPDSLTGQYLNGTRSIPIPQQRRPTTGPALIVHGARQHNLRAIDARFPLGTLIGVAGVSGSGKSSLVNDVLYAALAAQLHHAQRPVGAYDGLSGIEHIDKVIGVDQTPLGRSGRSNPATYTGIFDPLRQLFAGTAEARVRGYDAGRFSFNSKGGRCETCQGEGTVQIEMQFLPNLYISCEECHGTRYNRETLDITYRGYSIADILALTIEDAAALFANIPAISRRLQTLLDVGLGYLTLGQPAPTLSGGEAQRIKLATELARRATGRTLYILDEPTTGLHWLDIERLLAVLHRLVDAGNTVIVIEHSLDVLRNADWVIELGPGGGTEGGWIVAAGPPEEISANPDSWTGQFLARPT